MPQLKYWNGSQWVSTSPPDATTSTTGVVKISATPTSGNPIVSSVVGSVKDQQITTTSQTTMLSYTPIASGNFDVKIYFRVVTGTTNVTIQIAYADGTGVQVNTLYNAQSCGVGSYSAIPIYINAVSGTSIDVKITCSNANYVYASASIVAC